jgi:hypothetical protein
VTLVAFIKNGGPKAAAAEIFTGYAPFRPAESNNAVNLKPDQPIISNGTNQLRADILALDLFQNIH